jgi:trimeric autotransporter adhesin
LQSFTQVDSYELNIFNRYGENIFSTRNVTQPWDGTYKGKALPEGMYIYFLKVKSTDGFNLEKQGSITIIY